MTDKIEYNIKSSYDYNWNPTWFHCVKYDSTLINSISQFQKSQDIKPDGMCGPVTLKKKYSERLSQLQKHETNFLIFGGNPIPLKWDKVETFLDDSKWVSKYYNSEIGEKRRDIKYLVNHWDVTLSASHCHKILNSPKRGLSCHLYIDNDGTIIQTTDLQNITYHAGSRRWNRDSIGVEISNAFYPKWQKYYLSRGLPPRDVIKNAFVHGQKLESHLGFYPVQKEALRALYVAIQKGLGIPLQTPSIKTIHPDSIEGNYRGLIHHYHLTRNKIDSGSYDIQEQIDIIKKNKS